jgi:uncharacterized protein YydD (DUF2326 family)
LETVKISFKKLFNVFARRFGETYYTDTLFQQGRGKEDYHQKFVNLYLLGINTDLVERKAELNEKYNRLKKAQAAVKEYEKNDTTNPKDIKDRLDSIKRKKNNFIIAQNYNELKKEADDLTSLLNDLRDKVFKKEHFLNSKKFKLDHSTHVEINLSEVESVYNEAKFFFEKKVTKHLKDAQLFHKNLIESRKESLVADIALLTSEIEELE